MDSRVVLDERGHVPDLVCPGAAGCLDAEGAFRAGVAAVTITPAIETWEDDDGDGVRDEGEAFEDLDDDGAWDAVWIAGFGAGRAATGVHDDIWARALSFSRGSTRVGMVALDLVGFYHHDVLRIRQAAADAGLDYDHVIVASTHVHEAPDTQGLWGANNLESGYDEAYGAFVVARAVEALRAAASAERNARVVIARGEAEHLVSDSRFPKVMDPSVTAALFIDESDAAYASFVVFGNHPEVLDSENTLITSDYPHYVREALETFYPGSTSVFFSGTLGGLMNPYRVVGCPSDDGIETCEDGTFEKADYIGGGVANVAAQALEAARTAASAEVELVVRRNGFFLPPTNLALALAVSLGLSYRVVYTPEGKKLPDSAIEDLGVDDVMNKRVWIQTEVNGLRLGPLELLTVPGELYPELWLAKPDGTSWVERPEGGDFPDAPIDPPLSTLLPAAEFEAIINQANDALGYIIPKTQFDLLPPHAYEEDGQYGESVSSGYETAPSLAEATRALYAIESNPDE